MATVAVIQTDLILNAAAFRSGMAQAAATANSTLGSIRDQAASTASSLSNLSKAAVGLFAFEKIKEGVSALVETQVALQQVHYTLLSATGSAAVADETFQYLKETSTKLGLNLLDASKGFGQLAASAQASGIPLGQTKKLFEAFGEASTTLHLSTEQSTHALLALTEMMSAGTIHARQLNQQLGFAIPGSAARFKAAVMEAVKGTDLQGESFMHLMTEGKLVTSQFMPQLIQALQESGRGWESAVGGLNAQINLFSNAWLQLKNDVSGGLFNDAAIAGVGFMANNLERVAAAATLVASVGVARLLGSGAASVTGAFSGAVASVQSKIAETAATEANTAATVENARQRVVSTAIRARETAQAKLAAEAKLQSAAADKEETLARRQYQAATTAATKANLAYRDSLVSLTEAQAANVAAQEASTAAREAGVVGGLASKLGTGALALVGGPWGAAALAIGAVAYSFYSLVESEKEAKKAIDEQVKSMDELRPHIKDTIAAYKELGSSMTDSSFLEQWKQANDTISTTEKKIATIKAQLANIADSPHVASPYGGLNANSFDNSRAKELKDELARLEATLAPTKAQFLEMSATLRTELGPAFDKVREQAEKVNEQDFDKFVASLDDATRRAIANADQLRTAFSQGFQSLQSMAENYQHQSEDFAKNDAEKAYNEVRRRALAIYQTNAPDSAKQAAVAALVKEGAAAIKAAEGYDRLKSAKSDEAKAATAAREQQQAYESLIATIQTRIDQDKEATGQQSKLTAAQALHDKVLNDLNKSTSKLSAAQKEHVKAMLDEAVAAGAARKTSEEQIAADRNMLNLKRQLADEAERQARANAAAVAGVGHGSQWNTEQQALDQIAQAYQKRKEEADRAFKDETKGEQASAVQVKEHADAIALLDTEFARATAAQKKFYADQKAAQANWKNGAKSSFEDFLAGAANVAGQTKSLFDNAFSGMTDALTNFVTTGKLDFKGFVTSVLTDLARMELRIAESKILSMVLGGLLPGKGATGAGDALNGGANYTGSGSLSTSWAGMNSGGFGGGRAGGGSVSAGTLYEVNENGPELLTTGGRTYLMMGGDGGSVTPNGRGQAGAGSGSGGTFNVNTTVVVQANGQSSTSTKASGDNQALGKQLSDLVSAQVKEGISRAMLPGGVIWKYRVGQTA